MRHLLRCIALGLAFALAAALVPAAAATAADTDSPDGSWAVAPVAGGYQVTLRLKGQLEARDALPELAVNGTSVGFAQQSPDGRTLTVVTTDPAAAKPSSVRLAWNGEVPDAATAPATSRAPTAAPRSSGKTVPVDPTSRGHYAVVRADYDFGDTALTLSGLGDRAVEERAAVWVPAGAPGPRPVVIFLHGRHSACYDPTAKKTDNTHWPCTAGFQPIASYHGYDESAAVLSSHGYVVVSISADGINAQDNPYSDDAGTLARGQLVIDHLDLLAQANAGRAPGMSPLLKGRLDLRDVGLMGHSRGGEGVVKAALLNAALPRPYGIKAVLPLAPIDFGRETLPDVPMAVILPYCDGDVSNQQGQHFYDDTRYADPSDKVLRTSLMVMGADHNFFNSEWTPGVSVAPSSDDWSNEDDATCGQNSPTTTRLTAAQQYQVGVAYIAGFFRFAMGGETGLAAMFDGSQGRTTSVGAATVLQEGQMPRSQRLDVAPLQGPTSTVHFSGFATSEFCASMSDRSPQSGLPSCTKSTATGRFPSFTPANYGPNVTATPLLHVSWTSPGTMSVDLPQDQHNVGRYDALTLRAAIDDVSTAADLTLTVVDGAGRTEATTVSSVSDALSVLPGTGTLLPKTWLRTVQWPVARMKHVNVHDIRRVLVSTATPTGGVFLSDLAFQSSAVGAGGPSRLPQVSITGTEANEGNGPGTATVSLRLSHTSRVPVVANVQSLAGTGTQVTTGAQQVVIPPGQREVAVRIPIIGNTLPEPTADTVYKVFVVDPANAVIGQDFAHITVHDDDQATSAAN
ncbi:MAG: secreted protein [Actinoallomurus sp.]|nr:secreted protein [Actinoallomurus sp.]